MSWWLIMQAVSGPVLPAPVVKPKAVVPACTPSSDPHDITVCACTDEPYRLKKLPAGIETEKTPPKAAVTVAGGTLAAETEQADVGGIPSRRAMVRFKVPF